MHTARMWMALAIPGGAPGYDDDKELGNFITHIAAQTSQRLREHSGEPRKVKGSRRSARFEEISRVPGIRRVGICLFQPCTGCPKSRHAWASRPSAASGFTHSNSGSWCRNQVNWRLA